MREGKADTSQEALPSDTSFKCEQFQLGTIHNRGGASHINQRNQNNSRGDSLIRGLTKNLTTIVVFTLYYQNKEQRAVFQRPTVWPTFCFSLEFQLLDPGRSVAALAPLRHSTQLQERAIQCHSLLFGKVMPPRLHQADPQCSLGTLVPLSVGQQGVLHIIRNSGAKGVLANTGMFTRGHSGRNSSVNNLSTGFTHWCACEGVKGIVSRPAMASFERACFLECPVRGL